ncbi:hypothetical protein ACIRL2_00630 [Embleya sp. NPDC127516]|uniref:hypothetical protein n=1 Tax=Embleya sp. NPDC127516 TaxID=3363990 RepID=UPI0038150B97
MTASSKRKQLAGSTQRDLDRGRAFFERYRHAWCRDAYSGREGVLTDVWGRQVHLRLRSGIEFTCRIRDLVILRLPRPVLYERVAYVGAEDAKERPVGAVMELWAVDKGTLAIVQPPTGPAWFALSADLEPVDRPMGLVADWANPPFPNGSPRAVDNVAPSPIGGEYGLDRTDIGATDGT